MKRIKLFTCRMGKKRSTTCYKRAKKSNVDLSKLFLVEEVKKY